MVHPYLRRRDGIEEAHYPVAGAGARRSRRVAAGPGQDPGRAAVPGAGDADRHGGGEVQRRRGQRAAPRDGHLRARGTIGKLEAKMVERMVGARLRSRDFAERCFNQIKGFGDYGFPGEPCRRASPIWSTSRPGSNAIIRRRSPAALLNSPADGLLRAGPDRARCARAWRRGARARCRAQRLGCTLERRAGARGRPALRLGLRQIDGLSARMGRRDPGGARRSAPSAMSTTCRGAPALPRAATRAAGRGRCAALAGPRPAAGAVGGARLEPVDAALPLFAYARRRRDRAGAGRAAAASWRCRSTWSTITRPCGCR